MPTDTQEALALNSLAGQDTGIDQSLITTLIRYIKSNDRGDKIALLQKADKNASLALLLRMLDPENPNPELPASTVHALQNLRNTLILANTFRTKDEYLDILPRTNWIAPPDGTVKVGYSKPLVEAIALAHAYELSRTRGTADNLFDLLLSVITGPGIPSTQSSEFRRIVTVEGSERMPRLIRVYVESFAKAQIAGVPTGERQSDAIESMNAAHEAISAYKFDTGGSLFRKDYEQGYRIVFNKLRPGEKPSERAIAIANDINAGFGRGSTVTKSTSDVAKLKSAQKMEKSAFTREVDRLAATGSSDMSFRQRAEAIRQQALIFNPSAPVPPTPRVATLKELKDFAKEVKSVVTSTEPERKSIQQTTSSRSAARGIGIITALDSTPHTANKRTMLGSQDEIPPKMSEATDERIRKLDRNLGIPISQQ